MNLSRSKHQFSTSLPEPLDSFNPGISRVLNDIDLVYSVIHERSINDSHEDGGGQLTPLPTLTPPPQDPNNVIGRVCAAVAVVIIVVGVLGNFQVLVVIARCRRLHRSYNVLIASLAFTDLLFNSCMMPFYADSYATRQWRFSQTVCEVHTFVGATLLMTSGLHIGLIAINRYVLIVHGKLYTAISSRLAVAIQVGLVWIISFATVLPGTFGINAVVGYSDTVGRCNYLRRESEPTLAAIFSIGFVFPCAIMGGCYIAILRAIRRSRLKLGAHKTSRLATTQVDVFGQPSIPTAMPGNGIAHRDRREPRRTGPARLRGGTRRPQVSNSETDGTVGFAQNVRGLTCEHQNQLCVCSASGISTGGGSGDLSLAGSIIWGDGGRLGMCNAVVADIGRGSGREFNDAIQAARAMGEREVNGENDTPRFEPKLTFVKCSDIATAHLTWSQSTASDDRNTHPEAQTVGIHVSFSPPPFEENLSNTRQHYCCQDKPNEVITTPTVSAETAAPVTMLRITTTSPAISCECNEDYLRSMLENDASCDKKSMTVAFTPLAAVAAATEEINDVQEGAECSSLIKTSEALTVDVVPFNNDSGATSAEFDNYCKLSAYDYVDKYVIEGENTAIVVTSFNNNCISSVEAGTPTTVSGIAASTCAVFNLCTCSITSSAMTHDSNNVPGANIDVHKIMTAFTNTTSNSTSHNNNTATFSLQNEVHQIKNDAPIRRCTIGQNHEEDIILQESPQPRATSPSMYSAPPRSSSDICDWLVNGGPSASRSGSAGSCVGGRSKLSSLRMIFVIFLAFFFTYLPFVIVNMIGNHIDGSLTINRNWYVITSLGFWAGSCVNPIIYGIMNQQFRAAYADLAETVCLKLCRRF